MITVPAWAKALGLVAILLAIPALTYHFDAIFALTFITRILILAIGAISLNLVLGYGGMLSLCHATFVGIGAYVVGIGSHHAQNDGMAWMADGFVALAVITVVTGAVSALIGIISLRTRGIYFLMITMAFGQMLYLVAVGADRYGGDEGLTIFQPSSFAGFVLHGKYVMYGVSAASLCAAVLVIDRLSRSRFGLVLQSAKMNEVRTQALGYDPVRIRLVAFVISGVMAGLAGFLLANNSEFVSPLDLHWTRSADFVIMVVLGGIGTLIGPLLGAAFLLIVEQFASGVTAHWPIVLGAMVLAVALFMPRGLSGIAGSGGVGD